MWIMVGGPYGTGSKSAAERAANLARMNEAALAVWRKGHVPIIGVNLALPIVEAMRFCASAAPRSVRIGKWRGSWQRGKRVFRSVEEIEAATAVLSSWL